MASAMEQKRPLFEVISGGKKEKSDFLLFLEAHGLGDTSPEKVMTAFGVSPLGSKFVRALWKRYQLEMLETTVIATDVVTIWAQFWAWVVSNYETEVAQVLNGERMIWDMSANNVFSAYLATVSAISVIICSSLEGGDFSRDVSEMAHNMYGKNLEVMDLWQKFLQEASV